jgi:hypothetical protein
MCFTLPGTAVPEDIVNLGPLLERLHVADIIDRHLPPTRSSSSLTARS